MVSTLKSAGTLSTPGSVDQTENDAPREGERSYGDRRTVGDDELLACARVDLARRALGDIMEVVQVLARIQGDDLHPSVLQMVQQRVYELASGAFAALDDVVDPLVAIHGRIYPSEAFASTAEEGP